MVLPLQALHYELGWNGIRLWCSHSATGQILKPASACCISEDDYSPHPAARVLILLPAPNQAANEALVVPPHL